MKAVLIVSMVVICGMGTIRFADDEQMKSHHKHPEGENVGNITVHLIPHSHDDVGWLKTVDEYYYGSEQGIQWAGVQWTIDTVVSELSKNPEYRFSIVEMAFLYRWWRNSNEDMRKKLKDLVSNGQVEIINGGWCMSDEATVYYEDVIDQMTIGLRWVKETFDYTPKVGWHIDPFGHQASTATMFHHMGFNSFFFARIDYQDKQLRMSEQKLEMIWRPRETVPDSSNYIFAHVNYYHYSPPPGFCFDLLCKDQPIKDDDTLEDYNLIKKSQQFVNYFKSQALHYRTSNLLHTMGEDFHYANARMWYKNIDKLMSFINSRPEYGVKLVYSTPGIYTDAINKEGKSYPLKTDDFFPYADRQNAYWTGYFTSRVAIKGFVRDLGRWLQATRKYISELKMSSASSVIDNNAKAIEDSIWSLETSMGILQHHDAVSGTEKQKVANDYVATALRTLTAFAPLYKQIITEQINKQIGQNPQEKQIYMNLFWNQTAKQTGIADRIGANKPVLLALYNPGKAQKRIIRINVPEHDLKIVDEKNSAIQGDIFCGNLYEVGNCEVVFSLDMPESGNAYVKLQAQSRSASAKVVKLKELSVLESSKNFSLSSTASIKITRASQKFDLSIGSAIESFTINYNYYESYQSSGQKSGAYIFRPNGNDPLKYSTIKAIAYAEGTKAVIFTLDGDKTSTKLFFSKEAGYIDKYGFEIETHIDSIPINDKKGKEITMNIQTNLQSNKTFFTDSNGLEEQIRVIDFRPTWPLVVNQPVSGNYYPVNSHIGFEDTVSKKRFVVLTDRSQGGSVLREGEVQLMIHRRTLEDDSRGVGEPLNETQADGKGLKQTVRHYVVFGGDYRTLQVENDQKVMINIIGSSSGTFQKHTSQNCPFPVPAGVKLYLRPFIDNTYLLRLQNFNSSPTSVLIPEGWEVTEYTLSANQLKSDWEGSQLKWNEDSNSKIVKQSASSFVQLFCDLWNLASQLFFNAKQVSSQNDGISLNFLQVRTFKMIQKS